MRKQKENNYKPHTAEITDVIQLTERERLFSVIPLDGGWVSEFSPGQFMMVSVSGVGEAPISISSFNMAGRGEIEFCIRKTGSLTGVLHTLKKGDKLGLRGPFGEGVPIKDIKNMDILIVAGGLGLAPLRSLILCLLNQRQEYGQVTLLYGTRSPQDIIFKDEIKDWLYNPSIEVKISVDIAQYGWRGNVGNITKLFKYVYINPFKTVSVVTGPPVMYRFVIAELLRVGVFPRNIYLSLERRMRCGMGFCGHCQINGMYACKEGPVFRYDKIKDLPEAL